MYVHELFFSPVHRMGTLKPLEETLTVAIQRKTVSVLPNVRLSCRPNNIDFHQKFEIFQKILQIRKRNFNLEE